MLDECGTLLAANLQAENIERSLDDPPIQAVRSRPEPMVVAIEQSASAWGGGCLQLRMPGFYMVHPVNEARVLRRWARILANRSLSNIVGIDIGTLGAFP